MLTTPMILFSVFVAIVLLYFIAQLGKPSYPGRQPYPPAPTPQGYPSNLAPFQPVPAIEEEPPATGVSLWPIFMLVGAVAIFYLGYKYTPVQAEKPSIQKNTEATRPDNSLSSYEYEDEKPKNDRYYSGPEERKAGYIVPLSTPRIKREPQVSPQVQSYGRYPETQGAASTKNSKVPDYHRGYGVQLFATEKSWWEDARLRQIQENYPNLRLLIGMSNTSGNMNKFILGAFDTKATAAQFARQAEKAFPGAYVVDLSELKQVDRYWTVP